ncbi:IclR family transcriptional regulator [Verticiella sediminum]
MVALARGLSVLSCFRSGNRAMGNQELAERCGLPKSTVSRLTATLTRLGYLVHSRETGKYQLGMAALSLGSAMLARMDIRKTARPLMQELADFSGAMVALGVRDRLSMLYVECCRSAAALTLSLDVGSRIPLATSAIGRAWLAMAPSAERDDVYEQVRALDDVAWPRVRRGIETAQREYATYGVACSFGEWQSSVHGIARAFQPGNGMPLMAINCGGPAGSLSQAFLLDEVRPRLIALTQQLEAVGVG